MDAQDDSLRPQDDSVDARADTPLQHYSSSRVSCLLRSTPGWSKALMS
jgi:hypothetical protein